MECNGGNAIKAINTKAVTAVRHDKACMGNCQKLLGKYSESQGSSNNLVWKSQGFS